jgi:hypothetical protein
MHDGQAVPLWVAAQVHRLIGELAHCMHDALTPDGSIALGRQLRRQPLSRAALRMAGRTRTDRSHCGENRDADHRR